MVSFYSLDFRNLKVKLIPSLFLPGSGTHLSFMVQLRFYILMKTPGCSCQTTLWNFHSIWSLQCRVQHWGCCGFFLYHVCSSLSCSACSGLCFHMSGMTSSVLLLSLALPLSPSLSISFSLPLPSLSLLSHFSLSLSLSVLPLILLFPSPLFFSLCSLIGQ